MKIKVLPVTELYTNCYLVSADNAALVIDPGEYTDEAADFLNRNPSAEKLILLTHAHFDHIGGADRLRRETGAKVAIGCNDAAALSDSEKNLSADFGFPINPFSADILLKNGEKFNVGELEITALETPGHTPGGMCFLAESSLFSGDTLFAGSVGRTDFPGGDTRALINSLKTVTSALPDSIAVYPGHGGSTTLAAEKRSNPYMNGGLL